MAVAGDKGYIALISSIIISLLILGMTIALNISQFFGRFVISDAEYKEISMGLAEACAETAIVRLAENPSYTVPPTVGEEIPVTDDKSCKIISIYGAGSTRIVRTQGIFQNAYSNLELAVLLTGSDIEVSSWKELPTL